MKAPKVKGFHPMLQYVISGKDSTHSFRNKERALEFFKKFKTYNEGKYEYKFVKAKKYTHFIIYAENSK